MLDDKTIKLKVLSQRFVARITSQEMQNKLPRPIRAIAGLIKEKSQKYHPKIASSPLIGGFLMLRFFAPALVTPEAFCLLEQNEVPTKKIRTNFILVAKILQNISNGLTFETTKKEQHLLPLDDFVASQFEKIDLYYQQISQDPLQTEEPWKDLLNKKVQIDMQKIDIMGLTNLFELHRLIDRFKIKFLSLLKPENIEMIQLIQTLGPPPSSSSSISETSFFKSEQSLDFIYQGKPNKLNYPVFYIVVCKIDFKLDLDHLTNVIVNYINSAAPTQNICVVIDMSWTNSEELKLKFLQNTSSFSELQSRIPRQLNKRILEIHLIHPSSVNRLMMFFLRTFISPKFFSKVHEHEKWRTLSDWIDSSKIDLCEETKNFITKAYRVIKINAKGKKQNRIIKFTDNSILNIDPSSSTLKNEKMLNDINEISLTQDGIITLTFSEISAQKEEGRRRKLSFHNSLKDKSDLSTRRYLCSNKIDSQKFMEDVFEAAYQAQKIKNSLEYNVIKINQVGKSQERTFKLTCDSLLNLYGKKIKTEISYLGINSIEMDKNDVQVLWLQLKNEFGPRKIISTNLTQRNSLYEVLSAHIRKNTDLEEDENSEFKFQSSTWEYK